MNAIALIVHLTLLFGIIFPTIPLGAVFKKPKTIHNKRFALTKPYQTRLAQPNLDLFEQWLLGENASELKHIDQLRLCKQIHTLIVLANTNDGNWPKVGDFLGEIGIIFQKNWRNSNKMMEKLMGCKNGIEESLTEFCGQSDGQQSWTEFCTELMLEKLKGWTNSGNHMTNYANLANYLGHLEAETREYIKMREHQQMDEEQKFSYQFLDKTGNILAGQTGRNPNFAKNLLENGGEIGQHLANFCALKGRLDPNRLASMDPFCNEILPELLTQWLEGSIISKNKVNLVVQLSQFVATFSSDSMFFEEQLALLRRIKKQIAEAYKDKTKWFMNQKIPTLPGVTGLLYDICRLYPKDPFDFSNELLQIWPQFCELLFWIKITPRMKHTKSIWTKWFYHEGVFGPNFRIQQEDLVRHTRQLEQKFELGIVHNSIDHAMLSVIGALIADAFANKLDHPMEVLEWLVAIKLPTIILLDSLVDRICSGGTNLSIKLPFWRKICRKIHGFMGKRNAIVAGIFHRWLDMRDLPEDGRRATLCLEWMVSRAQWTVKFEKLRQNLDPKMVARDKILLVEIGRMLQSSRRKLTEKMTASMGELCRLMMTKDGYINQDLVVIWHELCQKLNVQRG